MDANFGDAGVASVVEEDPVFNPDEEESAGIAVDDVELLI